jgi:hypothetical protein
MADQPSSALFVLAPVYADYRLRIRIAPTAVMNRLATVSTRQWPMYAWASDLFEPNAKLVAVLHAMSPEQRNEMRCLDQDSLSCPIQLAMVPDSVLASRRLAVAPCQTAP